MLIAALSPPIPRAQSWVPQLLVSAVLQQFHGIQAYEMRPKMRLLKMGDGDDIVDTKVE